MLSATRPARTVTALLLGALALAVGGLAPAASAGVLDGTTVEAGDGQPPGGLPPVEVLSRSTLSPVLVVAPGCASAVVRLPLAGPVTWWVVTGAGTAAASQSQPVDPRGTSRLRAELSQGARFTDGSTRTEWTVAPTGADLVTGCEPVATPPAATPPAVGPPVATPPAVGPPVATPPVATPPVATPPVVKPPVATPPVLEPPVAPVSTPPVADPPTAPAGRPVAADRRAGAPPEPVMVVLGGPPDAAPAPDGAPVPHVAPAAAAGTEPEPPATAAADGSPAGSERSPDSEPTRTVALAATSSAGTTDLPVAGLVALLVLLVASGLAGVVRHRPASAAAEDPRRH